MSLSAWPPHAAARFYARPFGVDAADLDIDFSERRPFVVTALLRACLRDTDKNPYSESTLWCWTVTERLQGVLAIVYAGDTHRLPALARCSAVACATPIELELGVASFAQTEPPATCVCTIGDATLGMRVPTGDDQRHWPMLAKTGATLAFARGLVVAVNGAAPPDDWVMPLTWIEPVGERLADVDPLTALEIPVACPQCGTAVTVGIDLEQLMLASLAQRQRRLLDDIHTLADTYHWAEGEIMALPMWRRTHYLMRIHGVDA